MKLSSQICSWVNKPHFVESWHNDFMSSRRRKLSHIEPGQHLDGRPLGNTGCCCHYLLDSSKKWQQHPVFPQNESSKKCQQHPVFPGGLPSKYWPGSTLLNFSVFNLVTIAFKSPFDLLPTVGPSNCGTDRVRCTEPCEQFGKTPFTLTKVCVSTFENNNLREHVS